MYILKKAIYVCVYTCRPKQTCQGTNFRSWLSPYTIGSWGSNSSCQTQLQTPLTLALIYIIFLLSNSWNSVEILHLKHCLVWTWHISVLKNQMQLVFERCSSKTPSLNTSHWYWFWKYKLNSVKSTHRNVLLKQSNLSEKPNMVTCGCDKY